MSFAELRGKLSPESATDRSEDLLTSDVFGTIHFVGAAKPFVEWLASSSPVLDQKLDAVEALIPSPVRSIDVLFWPRLPNGREPDVALLLAHEDGRRSLIVVEVKYFSGLSNYDLDEDAEDGLASDRLTGHQLLDQLCGMEQIGCSTLLQNWFSIGREPSSRNLSWAHLLITTDRSLPKSLYTEVHAAMETSLLSKNAPAPYWVSWHALTPLLLHFADQQVTPEDRLIAHLYQLLKQKQLGSFAFRAFDMARVLPLQSTGAFWLAQNWFAPSELFGISRTLSDGRFWTGRQ
jgi:hypothetical protein